jgi:hypothetical protein
VLEKPRFRNDLVAQPIEGDDGYRYVDVTDPNSGETFRFYDVEYTIACAMDGARALPEIADWTRTELGIDTSTDELGTLVETLAGLGYLEGPGHGSDDETAVRPIPTAPPSNGEPGSGWTDETAQEVSNAYDQVMDLGPPGRSETAATTRVAKIDAPPVDLGPPGVGDAADATATPKIDTSGVELSPPHSETEQALADAMVERPAPKTMKEEEMSFAGLLDDVEASKAGALPKKPAAPETPPPRRIDTRAETQTRPGSTLGDDEPTNLPGAVLDDGEDDVSVDLSAHISLDKREVQEAVRSSKVISIPDLPPDVRLEDDMEEIEVTTEKESMRPRAETTRPPPPPPAPARPEIRATAPPAAPAVTLPDRPAPRSKPVEAPPPQKSSSLGLVVILLLLVIAGGVLVYLYKDKIFGGDEYAQKPTPRGQPTINPPPEGDKPPVVAADAPDAAAAAAPDDAIVAVVKEEAAPAEATVASPGEGAVAWVADEGSDIAAGAPVVKLAGYQKHEAKLKEGEDRLKFYEAELAKAKNPDQTAAMQRKVDEKKAIITEAQTALAPLVATAPAAGKVKILAAKFSKVKAGDPVVSIGGAGAGTGTVLRATFDVPADKATGYKPGPAVLAAKAARDKEFAGVIESVDGTKVTVRLVTGAPAKAGDEVLLK